MFNWNFYHFTGGMSGLLLHSGFFCFTFRVTLGREMGRKKNEPWQNVEMGDHTYYGLVYLI